MNAGPPNPWETDRRRKSRRRILARCARCRMHVPLCLCPVLPRLDTRTRVVLVPHAVDWKRPSNTGRLAVHCLRNAELAVVGRRGLPLDPTLLMRKGVQHLLLHPNGDAAPLEPPEDGLPVRLLVPDGTWAQSARIARRLAALPGVRPVRLSPSPKAGLRRAPTPERVGTAEAVAEALAVLGEPEAARGLREALRTMIDRTLFARGQLLAEQVHGGVPIEARRAMC